MTPQADGLIARIRQIRRASAPPSVIAPARPESAEGDVDQLADLTARVAHLEQLAQGLQDSVYREYQRQDRRIAEIEMQLDPATLAAALSKDARERGL